MKWKRMILWESQEMDGSEKTEISVMICFVLIKNVFEVLKN